MHASRARLLTACFCGAGMPASVHVLHLLAATQYTLLVIDPLSYNPRTCLGPQEIGSKGRGMCLRSA